MIVMISEVDASELAISVTDIHIRSLSGDLLISSIFEPDMRLNLT